MTQDDIEKIKTQGAIVQLKQEILGRISSISTAFDGCYNMDDEFVGFSEAASSVTTLLDEASSLFYELRTLETKTHK